MVPLQQHKEALKRQLLRVPVLKLPARKLEPCLTVLIMSSQELRQDVVKGILSDVYPNFNEKRAFRALVAPTLTRLHFARSEPPYFRLAPNARIWKQLDDKNAVAFLALVLFDFARVRLQLPADILPPIGGLREAAHDLGPTMVDRVRGLDSMLRYYYSKSKETESSIPLTLANTGAFRESHSELERLMTTSIPRDRTIAMDEVRYQVMKNMLSRAILASSFVVDEWVKQAIRGGILFPSRAAFASIDALTMEGYAINTVRLKPRV